MRTTNVTCGKITHDAILYAPYLLNIALYPTEMDTVRFRRDTVPVKIESDVVLTSCDVGIRAATLGVFRERTGQAPAAAAWSGSTRFTRVQDALQARPAPGPPAPRVKYRPNPYTGLIPTSRDDLQQGFGVRRAT